MTVWRLIEYVMLVGLMTLAIWLASKLLRVPSTRNPGTVVVGSPWVEAEDAFSHALAEHRRAQLAAAMTGHPDRLGLPSMDDLVPPGQHPARRSLGERSIPVRRIVGSADPASGLFDREFRPTDSRSRTRFESVYVAMRTGAPLPLIDVYEWQGNYFVSDGLHRVAVARALGQDYIAAQVTNVVG